MPQQTLQISDDYEDIELDPSEYIRGDRKENPSGAWIARYLNGFSLFLGIIGTLVIGILTLFHFYFAGVVLYWLYLLVSLVFTVGAFSFWISGFFRVQEQQRVIIETFGAYNGIKEPGLRRKNPVEKIENERGRINIWQTDIKLFPDMENNGSSMDFRDGGSAIPQEPKIWVEPIGNPREPGGEKLLQESIKRAFYEIENWRELIRSDAEESFRTISNNLSVEETISFGRSPQEEKEGSVKEQGQKKPQSRFLERMLEEIGKKGWQLEWWDLMRITKDPALWVRFKKIGFRVTRVNLGHFKWNEQVKDIRRSVFQEARKIEVAELSAEAAKHEAHEKAIKVGVPPAEIARFLFEEYGWVKKKAKKTAIDLVMYFEGTEKGAVKDFRGGTIGEGGPEDPGKVFAGVKELIADNDDLSTDMVKKIKNEFFSDLDLNQ